MNKICFVTTVPVTLRTFIFDTAKYMLENGDFDITFICNDEQFFKDEVPVGIKYIPVSMKRGISISGIRSVISLYRVFKREEFDLVQYSTPNASFYAAIASWAARVPVRLYCQWGIAYVGFSGIKRKIFKIIERCTCLLSTRIEPDSEGNLLFSNEEGLYPLEKGAVIWNGSASGVDLKKFDINKKEKWRKEIRVKYDINENSLLIGFVGRLNRDKGINELLECAHQITITKRNVVFMMIGGLDEVETIDKNLLSWSQTEENIMYVGQVTQVEKYYAAMDIFVLPSYREGFGSVVIEAEAMGVPVIVTDIPGPTDAMINGETGIVVKRKDVKSLLDALLMLLEDTELRRSMGEAGNTFATEKFNSEELMNYILLDRESLLDPILQG